MEDLISIIVPVYKVEKYLQNCIDSIINQTYANLEIILVDDGSPDNCGKICDDNASNDKRIKVIHKANGGLSDARNAGIDIAEGKYITFIDSDDFILRDMIRKLYEMAIRHDSDYVECRRIRCKEEDTIQSIIESDADIKTQEFIGNEKMSVFFQNNGADTTAWGKLYKTDLFEGVRYPKGKMHEDVFTTYKVVHKASKLVITDYKGYVYRVNAESITSAEFSDKKLDMIEGKIQQSEFIERNYPELAGKAKADIVYACNQCILQISKSKTSKASADAKRIIQRNYRKYGWYYLVSDREFLKKMLCIIAMINIDISILFLSKRRAK